MKKITEKHHKKRFLESVYKNAIQLILVGAVTGILVGLVLTFFNVLAHEAEEIACVGYAYVRANPAFLPLLIVALLIGAFLLAVALRISTIAKGCGIPQAEGAARGVIRFRWWSDAVTMFAASLLSIFMGLSIGAEGPSVLIGACLGDGVATTLRRDEMIKRYQITGGACTGLAVASNAPLTGIVFAFEEAHKRFTPEVFICSFVSVIFGMMTRSAIYSALGKEIESAFHSYVFHALPITAYGYVVIAGVLCGLLGVGFFKASFAVRRLFKRIKLKNHVWNESSRIFIGVLLGGLISFLAAGVMGGGHTLIENLGTLGGTVKPTTESVFGLPLLWSLFVILLLKFLVTNINVGSGIPCGIFIPIIAIGACVGALLNGMFTALGMDAQYADLMIMICMASFFATVVRAPLTAVIMICEFTGSFAPLLPVIIAVAIGFIIGDVSRTDGMYEELLKVYERENGIHERAVREVYELTLTHGAIAEGREVRDVLWPSGARVVEIRRGEEVILPDGDTVLHGGDILKMVCKTDSPERVKDELVHILG